MSEWQRIHPSKRHMTADAFALGRSRDEEERPIETPGAAGHLKTALIAMLIFTLALGDRRAARHDGDRAPRLPAAGGGLAHHAGRSARRLIADRAGASTRNCSRSTSRAARPRSPVPARPTPYDAVELRRLEPLADEQERSMTRWRRTSRACSPPIRRDERARGSRRGIRQRPRPAHHAGIGAVAGGTPSSRTGSRRDRR